MNNVDITSIMLVITLLLEALFFFKSGLLRKVANDCERLLAKRIADAKMIEEYLDLDIVNMSVKFQADIQKNVMSDIASDFVAMVKPDLSFIDEMTEEEAAELLK